MYPPRYVSFLTGPTPTQLYPASPVYPVRLTDGQQVRPCVWRCSRVCGGGASEGRVRQGGREAVWVGAAGWAR